MEVEVKSIDSLGRVVIPKAIRKSLNILEDTLLGIEVIDNKIVLSKIDFVANKDNDLLIKILKKLTNSDVFITNMYKIIASDREEFISRELTKEFIFTLQKRKKQMANSLQIIEDFKFDDNFLIYPILKNSVLYGSIVIFLKNIDIFNKNEVILDLIVKLYLENYS